MRLSRFAISNFRNFQSVDIALSNHAIFVWENQVGKSNLIHAILAVRRGSGPGGSFMTERRHGIDSCSPSGLDEACGQCYHR